MRRAHQALSQVPEDHVITVSLEDLVVGDRQSTYESLLAFLGLPDRPRIRRFFEQDMPADRVRIGSWSERVRDPERLNSAYQQARQRLVQEGIEVFERS